MEMFLKILGVIWMDLILSGDNALVIGSAVSRLEPQTGRRAAAFGVGVAAAMRITFILIVSLLLEIEWVRIVGGVLIFYVVAKLWLSIKDAQDHKARSGKSVMEAIFIILIADLSLSLDNVLVIASIANRDLIVVIIGIVFSIAFMFISAQLLANLIRRYPWILYLACLILAYVGFKLILEGLESAGVEQITTWKEALKHNISLFFQKIF